MMAKLIKLESALRVALGENILELKMALDEITLIVGSANYLGAMGILRDNPELNFEELIDLCGVDYSGYGNFETEFTAYCHSCQYSNRQQNR